MKLTVGSSGFILGTNDSGASWHKLDSRLNIYYAALDDVTFTDEKEGWIVGWQLKPDPEPDSSIVLHTSDGGISWERQVVPYSSRVARIWAISRAVLWAFGGDLAFFTVDGGRHWQLANVRAEEGIFRDIHFRNSVEGFLLTDKAIYQTLDGGRNWSKQAGGFEVQFLRRMAFAGDSKVWLLGRTAVDFPTYETTNGGRSWNRSTHTFTAITFIDSLNGFAIQNGAVYRSIDGGNIWKLVSEDPAAFASWTSNQAFTDAMHGWTWNSFNVHHTTDGGRTWLTAKGISRVANVFPGGLFMLNQELGWAVGSDGWIFKYEADPMTSVFNPFLDSPPAFKLFDNYPNPFNPKTTIRYVLPSRERIEVSLFNIFGQKVKVLFFGMQDPGMHSLVLDGSELSSGIYFCQLRAKSLVETKKCLLVK
ncbi:MAG: YCF48-related protein [bacterium]